MSYKIIEHTNSEFSAVLDRIILLLNELAEEAAASGTEVTDNGWAFMEKEFKIFKKSRDLRLGSGIAIDEHYWNIIDIVLKEFK